MDTFSLDHLSDVEFEEFCYELLGELGFVNLNWRKGTGLTSSSSDNGRDIECQLERTDIDGKKYLETWFVECKHYKKGVPPAKIQNVLTWGMSKSIDYVLIIASNHLSNSAKNYINDFTIANNPRYKIKVWERPDLEKLTLGKTVLARKYRIVGEFPFLNILHPAHILYIQKSPFNSLDYLFKVLDEIDSKKRDSVLGGIYRLIIQPKSTYHTSKILGMDITVTDQTLDEVSYDVFKEKCYQILYSGLFDQALLTFLIISFSLRMSFAVGDTSTVDERMQQHEEMTQYLRKRAIEKPQEKDEIESMIETTNEIMSGLPERARENYQTYEYFCENVVSELFLEEMIRNSKYINDFRS